MTTPEHEPDGFESVNKRTFPDETWRFEAYCPHCGAWQSEGHLVGCDWRLEP